MKKLLALATVVIVVLLLSVGPVAAQTYPVAIDRNAITVTYWPTGGTSGVAAGVSYRLNPQWDVLLGYRSGAITTGTTLFTLGGRYHLQPPSSGLDVYATLQYASPSGAGNVLGTASYLMAGGGLVATIAPGVKSFFIADLTFQASTVPYPGSVITPKFGFQLEQGRQYSIVAGVDLGPATSGYLGVNFDLSVR